MPISIRKKTCRRLQLPTPKSGRVQRNNDKKNKGPYEANRDLSQQHRDNPGDGCTIAALAAQVACSAPELKAALEQGFEEIVSASGEDRR